MEKKSKGEVLPLLLLFVKMAAEPALSALRETTKYGTIGSMSILHFGQSPRIETTGLFSNELALPSLDEVQHGFQGQFSAPAALFSLAGASPPAPAALQGQKTSP